MNHNDAVTELADRVLNVEIWIDYTNDDVAHLNPDEARLVLTTAGVALFGLPRKTAFDGCYHVDVTRAWWDAVVRSGDDLDVEVSGYRVHLALF